MRQRFVGLRRAAILLGVASLVACAGGLSNGGSNGAGFAPSIAGRSTISASARSSGLSGAVAVDLGVRAASAPVDVVAVLKYNDRAGLERFVDELGSPGNHTYLTHEAFMARYAPTQRQLDDVVQHLRASGFTIVRTYPNRLVVDASASSATVSRYFGTSIHSYRQGRYGERFANVRPVRMPAELAGLVDAVVIDNVVRMRPAVGDPPPLLLSGPPHDAAVASGEQNAIGNPGFESGKLSPWFACSGASNVPGGKVAHTKPHSGKYDAFAGNLTASTSEVDGLSGICQDITVPSKATFSYWVRPVSNDSNKTDVGQFVALYDQSTGKLLKTLYGVDANSSKWIAEKVSFGAYAGKKFLLFFGVVGSPADEGKYVGLYVDDVSLEGEATPTPKPTEKPTTKPSTKPTSSPTAGPTGNPITGPSTYNGFWGPGALVAPFAYPLEAGYSGAGVTVGVVMASPVQSSDIDAYKKYFGVPSDGGKVENINVDGGTTFSAANDASVEATLDVETIAGLAPGAKINVYVVPELADNYALDAYNTIASDSAVKVVNSSFSGCEANDPAYDQSTDDIALMGAAQGVTFAASSGDQGTECFSNGAFVAGVGSPASDPHFVGVGGTESYPQIGSTQVWDDAYLGVPGGGAGGGGLSTEWASPSYQKGISGASTTHRNVPDIALPAVDDAIYVGGAWTAVDGTSWASPLYAAMQADIDEACGAQYGLAELYAVYKAHPSDFIDVTSGNNEYGGTAGYNAVKGFDLASGMGSPLGTSLSYRTCGKPAK